MVTITALNSELTRMRRRPEDFTILREDAKCKLCYKKTAVDLGHPNNPANAGTWCPVHGWLMFDSVGIPPTERLKPYEIEANKEAEKRKAAFARRKANEKL